MDTTNPLALLRGGVDLIKKLSIIIIRTCGNSFDSLITLRVFEVVSVLYSY